MEFSAEQWCGLRDHARDAGLVFLSSPFSVEAVTLLDRLEMAAWKVASGEVNNPLLLEAMAATGKPALISSGMSTWAELDGAVARFREQACPVALLQCTTAYPCPPERIGLDMLDRLRERYQAPVGLSDHSGTIFAAIAAATMGANLVELHVTLSREMFGPDVPASVTTSELRQVVEGLQFVHRAQAAGTNKDQEAVQLQPLRAAFGKSLVARHPLPAGAILRKEDLTAKKPGRGIPASEVHSVVGMRVLRALSTDEFLRRDDLADAG
jgi:N-acetylneuraminate synthase